MYYYGARYYDPRLSIFISVDPLAEDFVGWTPYHYVHNNPINLIDPTGMSAEDCCGDNGDRPFGQPDFEQQPPKKEPIYLTAEIYSAKPLMGYPGQALEEGITAGIQWLGEQLSGSDVSTETAENIKTGTNVAVAILSKGKNQKANAEVLKISDKAKSLLKQGRSGKQERLKELSTDPKLGKSDKGWIKQDMNQIDRGKRRTIRNPPGKDLAHQRGREASKGYSYKYSYLQNRADHRTQHKYDNFGKLNKERKVHIPKH